MSKLKLSDISNGALQEQFDAVLEEVLANIVDPNRKRTDPRSITIKLEFHPKEDKTEGAGLKYQVKSNLAPRKKIGSTVFIEKDLKSGQVEIEEYMRQLRGQVSMEDVTKEQSKVTAIRG